MRYGVLPVKQNSEKDILAFKFNGFAVLVPGMLITALTLNVVALQMPFMKIWAFAEGTETYSILRTVHLMWQFKFYWIAILIVIFSVIFPFVKHGTLLFLWYLPIRSKRRGKWLHSLCQLGRWSLLDVFISLVLIVLAHDQKLIVISTNPGLPLFLIAICLSMGTGQLMGYLHEAVKGEAPIVKKEKIRASTNSGWRAYVVPILLLGNLAALIAAIGVPYIKITAVILHKNSYSIIETVVALFSDGKYVFSLVVLAFLVVMPIMRLLTVTLLWYWKMHPRRFRRAQTLVRDVGYWAMLDVFGLALILFIAEGGRIIKIEERSGVWALITAIALNLVLGIIIRRVFRKQLARIEGSVPA